jgi:2-dehydro-3-deoxy-D-gluconate 5-dehydrogenase
MRSAPSDRTVRRPDMKALHELLDLSGRVAIVTGSAKGIGQGIAYRLGEAGATVIVADIDYSAARRTAQDLIDAGGIALAWKVDVSSEAEIQAMMTEIEAEYGSVDILVNNAGIYPSMPVADMTERLFDRVMRVNLRSVFLATKHAAEVMRRHGGGKIINITSIDALHPSMVGLAHYDASKHGEWGFTKNSALELAKDNITVNAIAPGGIITPGTTDPDASADLSAGIETFLAKIPMHRMGVPDEIGTVALFLASEMSSYMTGAQIVVDGGALLS